MELAVSSLGQSRPTDFPSSLSPLPFPLSVALQVLAACQRFVCQRMKPQTFGAVVASLSVDAL